MQSSRTNFFLCFSALLLLGCSDYKYGIHEDSYPHLFPAEPPLTNNVLKYNKDYSWLTRVPLTDQTIEIEHGVLVSEEDRERLSLPEGSFLFSSISFKEPTKLGFSISYEHQGSPLPVFGTYVFEMNRDEECKIIDRSQGWGITRLETNIDTIERKCPFGLVRISRMPEGLVSELVEDLNFVVNGEPTNLSFTIEWHKASTAFWRLNTIT